MKRGVPVWGKEKFKYDKKRIQGWEENGSTLYDSLEAFKKGKKKGGGIPINQGKHFSWAKKKSARGNGREGTVKKKAYGI